MKQDMLTRGGNTGTPLPGRRDSMGVSLLGSTPSSSTLSSSSNSSISSISSSSSGEERRKGGGEEFIGREEEEGEVVSISIVTIAEESCPSEPFGTVGGHVEVTANESAARERDGQSKTSHSTQTEEEGVRNGEEGRKEDDEKEQGDEGEEEEEAEEMGEDESDRSALLEEETDEEGRNQVFVSDENPETPSALLNIKMKRKLDHGPDIRPFPSGKKHCKGSTYLSPSSFVPFQTTPTTFGDLRAANGHSAQRRRVTSGPPPSGLQDWLHTFQAWSGPERLLALDELIDSCESNQVKHMMQVIEPQFQRDFISLLPKEVNTHTHTQTGHTQTGHTHAHTQDTHTQDTHTDRTHTHTHTHRQDTHTLTDRTHTHRTHTQTGHTHTLTHTHRTHTHVHTQTGHTHTEREDRHTCHMSPVQFHYPVS
uniref:F-box/WD repeat-containing protein 7-like n=1 Tax=Salmo trutta TaxID=8032 RepID=A0A673WHN0_SALTR